MEILRPLPHAAQLIAWSGPVVLRAPDGFDMSCVKRLAMQEPVVDVCDAEQICTSASCVLSIDLATVQLEDLAFSAQSCMATLRPSECTSPPHACLSMGQGSTARVEWAGGRAAPSRRLMPFLAPPALGLFVFGTQVQSSAFRRRAATTCTRSSHTLIALLALVTNP